MENYADKFQNFHFLRFTDVSANSDLASCFMNLGLIKDDPEEDDLEELPPEPFFVNPLAEMLAAKAHELKKKLRIVPPSHYHSHDYFMSMNDELCIVVGEGKSGKDLRQELDKCLPGMCKSLQVMSNTVGMTSAADGTALHLGYVDGIDTHGSETVTALFIDSVNFPKRGVEGGYGRYITKILETLDLFVRRIVDSDDLYVLTPEKEFMHPSKEVDGKGKNPAINVPGIYRGLNAAFIKDYYREMFDVYIQGHENRIAECAYPQSVNCSHGDEITLHLNPMVCKHLKKDVDVKYLNGVKLTQQMSKGKNISYICLILCIELKREGKFCETKTINCT